MKKDILFTGIVCLLIGVVIGFLFANSINRSTSDQKSMLATSSLPSGAADPNLPPGHPPLSQTGDDPQNGPIPEVTAAIEKAKQEPKSFEAQMAAGDMYYQIQRFEDAAQFYEKANQLRPNESETLVKLGNSYFDSEKYEEAEKWYRSALQKAPNDISVRTDLGLTFFLRTPRDLDRAIKEYQIALGQDPNNEGTLQNLTLAYREKDDKENLQKTLERLIKANPNNSLIKEIQDGQTPPDIFSNQ
ncbi:MAG: tetratricopeptide repeat protein [Acidobacteria bacterium]|nr:tetratricopeptide repeat protein [Acidobacteriota bacterium]